MTRAKLHRLSGWAPVALSLAALSLVVVALTTGWQRDLPDEGGAAHLFQLLIVGELPAMAVFVMTADGEYRRDAAMVAIQLLALGAALAPVAIAGL